jgi:FlaA1/EpsC-like NDP-sugar epimerase
VDFELTRASGSMRERLEQAIALPVRLLSAPRRAKLALAILADVVSGIVAAWIGFGLRLGELVGARESLLLFVAVALPLTIITFFVARVYQNVFRFSGPKGLGQIGFACLMIMVPLILVFGITVVEGIPRTMSAIYPIMLFLLVSLNRIVARYLLVSLPGLFAERKRVLIYGAGTGARQLATSIVHEPGYRLIGYVDDAQGLSGQRIEGIRILSHGQAEQLMGNGEIDLVLLAFSGQGRSARAAIIERLEQFDVHVQVLPRVYDLIEGDIRISDLREIEITDLLAREPVAPDPQLIALAITGKTVLVTGAGGSIGSELCRQIVQNRPECVILFEMTEAALYEVSKQVHEIARENGITCRIVDELSTVDNPEALARLFEQYRPHTVFHAAAYKHVPLVEANVIAGARNNIFGTLNCAVAAQNSGVERFILISTDKAVRPTNVMGATKRVCEIVLQALSEREGATTKFAMVRFGNVLGSSGSVVPLFQRQISAGGPVTLTHRDITRFFMTISEAAQLVIQAGAMARGGEVYLLDMGKPVRIYDLARTMIRLSGRSVRDAEAPDGDIEIVEIGLRPGEKLYEELLIDAEAEPTDHARIFRANEAWIPWDSLRMQLDQLATAIADADRTAIRELLHRLVPGFQASGSSTERPAGLSAEQE